MDKGTRNELLGIMSDVTKLIDSLESVSLIEGSKKAAELAPQLLSAYDLKFRILTKLNDI